MHLLLLLAACTGKISSDEVVDENDDTSVVDTDDTSVVDSGDSGDDTDTGSTNDTVGPDLPACTPSTGAGDRVALSGVVLTPTGPVAGVLEYARSTGLITCVGDCDTTGADVVCTEGIISPGLIDAHNHLQYNSLPPWEVGAEFTDRYEWRSDDRYYEYRTAYDAIKDSYSCEIDKWAEARELVHGTTSAVGSYGDACIDVLIRNLDEDSAASGISGFSMVYSASTVTDSIDSGDCSDYTSDLASGSLGSVLEHVAEGRSGSVRDEIDHMTTSGCVGPGQTYVHATDASTEQLAQMASSGTSIVWSPRSNLALYGTTTPIEIADKLGVFWAIGTDWTPSGSMAPTRELACASEWLEGKGNPISDIRLWEKVTTDAARIVGLDGVIGELNVGYRADVAVFTYSHTPYRAIIDAEPLDTTLVVLEGAALYGQTDWVNSLAADASLCESLDVCGDARTICARTTTSGQDGETIAVIEATLNSAMNDVTMPSGYEYGKELFPLFTCTEERPSCDLRAPTADDADGDGIADSADDCPTVYDPNQWDTDADGEGDSCDDCPIDADATTCVPVAGDADGDSIPDTEDNCVTIGNLDQADADADGKGDVCDPCPDESNPGSDGCTMSIPTLRDPTASGHPEDGTVVTLEGNVVSAVRAGSGFYLQDTGTAEFGGIYVYDHGDSTVAAGDVVTVTGTYTEYYGLSEISDATATVTSSGTVPASVLIGDACSVGTSGALAEAYESVLVTVSDLVVTNTNPDDPSDYDEFEVNGCLRVDDLLYVELDQPAMDTPYDSITGVLTYAYDNFKIEPRDAEDLQ